MERIPSIFKVQDGCDTFSLKSGNHTNNTKIKDFMNLPITSNTTQVLCYSSFSLCCYGCHFKIFRVFLLRDYHSGRTVVQGHMQISSQKSPQIIIVYSQTELYIKCHYSLSQYAYPYGILVINNIFNPKVLILLRNKCEAFDKWIHVLELWHVI